MLGALQHPFDNVFCLEGKITLVMLFMCTQYNQLCNHYIYLAKIQITRF